jgi:hypothetical protein
LLTTSECFGGREIGRKIVEVDMDLTKAKSEEDG